MYQVKNDDLMAKMMSKKIKENEQLVTKMEVQIEALLHTNWIKYY